MKTFKTMRQTTILVSALMFVTFAHAQDSTVNLAHLDRVLAEITKNETELAQLLTKYAPSHPEILARKSHIDALHAELAALNPHGALEYPDPSMQLRQTMQRFADTMEELSNQIEAIEKLGNQIGIEIPESRKAFFESSETMFLAAKKHFAELENLLGAKPLNAVLPVNPDQPLSILSQAQQAAEVQKLQALAMQTAALDAYKRALENADPSGSREQRLDQFDERLSRIEKLLEKLLAKEGS